MNTLDKYRLKASSLLDNASTRLPVCICVDRSYSMNIQKRMHQVNEGIERFISEIRNNTYAVDSVELCIVAFGDKVETVCPFDLTTNIKFNPIVPAGDSRLGAAVLRSLEAIDSRVQSYKLFGRNAYKPWLIIISDGVSTDSIEEPRRKCLLEQDIGNLKVLCVGVGDEPNDLAAFKRDGDVVQLDDFKLSDFFSWLSKSLSQQSKQTPENDIGFPETTLLKNLGK